ncbi:MAG TPA: ABC transporter permease subunit, partial [Dehalococcoidia bacterium]|nr:ABC transporter permease subunit [Dehalococcoidia bacterium]
AVVMAHSRPLERALYPLALVVKVTPVVAVAPLFIIWFGFGIWPKLLVAALITFFPMLVNAVTGLRDVDPAALDFLRSLHASRWQVFWRLRGPASLPYLFAALRISVPLALIGAVVAEWMSGDGGLGQVILIANGDFDTASLFAAVLVLAALAVLLSGALALLERTVLFWHESFEG